MFYDSHILLELLLYKPDKWIICIGIGNNRTIKRKKKPTLSVHKSLVLKPTPTSKLGFHRIITQMLLKGIANIAPKINVLHNENKIDVPHYECNIIELFNNYFIIVCV